jgi:hypothetical protein
MSPGGVNPSRHTACVFFVVGKNYRLQDIQLSKIIRGKNPSDTVGGLGISPPDPLTKGMENTGLEPVTSWLQTRRSPS